MPQEFANNSAAPYDDSRHYILLTAVAIAVSAASLIFYYRQNAILLYGDAVAHINIARRVFDSRTPGIFQLGTVWLPLPHLLDIPFVINDRLWQTGVGASIVSMAAYIAGVFGIFRLLRSMGSRLAAWTAALIYALNPNLIYMQATPMTESLYLALFVWAIVYFAEFARDAAADFPRGRRSLEKAALVLAAAMLVRYDGWFLAALMAMGAFLVLWFQSERVSVIPEDYLFKGAFASQGIFIHGSRQVRLLWTKLYLRTFLGFALLLLLTGGVWLAYNYNQYGNALEFANGPYSARAIQQRSWTPTWTSYPGENSARAATLYFLKASRLMLGEGRTERLLFAIAFASLLSVFYFARRFLPWVFLWMPAVFYPACIAWGSVPVYVPQWWPFSYYNVRYGLQMLPAVAVFTGLLVDLGSKIFPRSRCLTACALLIITGWSYSTVWRRTPIMLREAEVNGRARLQFDQKLASELYNLPGSATIMMDCSAHSGAVQMAGIPFQRVLRESNPPEWEIALSQPAKAADYIVAIDQDAVAYSVHLFPKDLEVLKVINDSGGPKATIYRSLRQ
ncbi:MAG TPA: hypothetical protein VJV96_00015 [Candidatus Angelobacter sp.]|nr:hypothetical protein [Candidatus Angelobacter sp.]